MNLHQRGALLSIKDHLRQRFGSKFTPELFTRAKAKYGQPNEPREVMHDGIGEVLHFAQGAHGPVAIVVEDETGKVFDCGIRSLTMLTAENVKATLAGPPIKKEFCTFCSMAFSHAPNCPHYKEAGK